MPVGVLNPTPKLIDVVPFVLIVYVPELTPLSVSPVSDPIALIVVVAVTEIGPVYFVELCVGVEPSVV
jgi:hypothetical protein